MATSIGSLVNTIEMETKYRLCFAMLLQKMHIFKGVLKHRILGTYVKQC